MRFRNHYACSNCGTTWSDVWDAVCDDRCPKCDTSCSPTESEDVAWVEVALRDEIPGPISRLLDDVSAALEAAPLASWQKDQIFAAFVTTVAALTMSPSEFGSVIEHQGDRERLQAAFDLLARH